MIQNNLQIRPIPLSDSFRLWEHSAKEPFYTWALTNAPYFNDFKQMTYHAFMLENQSFYIDNENVQGLYIDQVLIGTVNRYWQDKQTRWLEVGIVIFDDSYWNKGFAFSFLKMWIQNTFDTFEIERVGLTTWSGNPGMIRVGKKLGMTQDRTVKKARYYNETYYDSIGFGITRSSWNELYNSNLRMSQIQDSGLKSKYCEVILRQLPEWFGIEESTQEYIDNVSNKEMFIVTIEEELVGFLSLDNHIQKASEIYVMGVNPKYHRLGVGKQLVNCAVRSCRLSGKNLMLVKTLSDTIDNNEYSTTRSFYQSCGFINVHEDLHVWGQANPCLIMALPIY